MEQQSTGGLGYVATIYRRTGLCSNNLQEDWVM